MEFCVFLTFILRDCLFMYCLHIIKLHWFSGRPDTVNYCCESGDVSFLLMDES